MDDISDHKKGKVPLKNFLEDFRSPRTDAELRNKYDLSARNFVNLIKALLSQNLITPEDLTWRRQMAVQRDLAKESEFLSGLYICPHCNHPHPKPFKVCPACEGEAGDAFEAQEMLDAIFSTSGKHALVEEKEVQDVAETQELDASELPFSSNRALESDEESEQEDKPSTLDSFRSIISKLKKK